MIKMVRIHFYQVALLSWCHSYELDNEQDVESQSSDTYRIMTCEEDWEITWSALNMIFSEKCIEVGELFNCSLVSWYLWGNVENNWKG